MTAASQESSPVPPALRFNRHGPIDPPDEDAEPFDIEAVIRKWRDRTPAQIQETRRRIFALSPPPRPLPPGKTLNDMVEGTWPGDETDEEILRILEEMS